MPTLTDEHRNTFFKIVMHDYLTDKVGMALTRLQIQFRQSDAAPKSIKLTIQPVEKAYAEGMQKSYMLAEEFGMTIEELMEDPEIEAMVDLGNKVAEAIADNASFFREAKHVDEVIEKFRALQKEDFSEDLLNELFIEHVRTEPEIRAVSAKK